MGKNKKKKEKQRKSHEKQNENPYDSAIVPKVRQRLNDIAQDMESDLPELLYAVDGFYYHNERNDGSKFKAANDPGLLVANACEMSGDVCEVGIYRLVDVRVFKNEVTSKKFEDSQDGDF